MSRIKERIAGVAVPVPVAGEFHYLVPPDMDLKPGARVLVPFGRRRVTGYVLEILEDSLDPDIPEKLKEVIRPLDEEPLFGPDLTALFRFAANYYHYPLGLVIAEALPSGLKVMSWKTALLTPAGRRALEAGPPREAAGLLTRLARPQGLTLARLIKEKGDTLKLLRQLERDGLAVVETRLDEERVRPRVRRWLTAVDPPPADQIRLGPREKELLALAREQGPVPEDDLRDRFPNLRVLVRRLQVKGRLEVEERPLYRDSLGRALSFEPTSPTLTNEQAAAAAEISRALTAGRYQPFLLHGVTGSGKTEVYLTAARQTLDQGRRALFLVPEISLTPALEGLLRSRFQEETAVLHSALSEAERYDQWLKISRGRARLVLGARSAVFAPMEDLGLVVVDEEHDGAYKQEDKLRYQARDLALWRGRRAGAAVVLGSATPSLESYHAADQGRYRLLTMEKRIGRGRLPRVEVVDLRSDGARRRALTPALKNAVRESLEGERQALLFINRRGLAGLPMCLACGHVIKCFNCSVTLTRHQDPRRESDQGDRLICHHCGFDLAPPAECPECGSSRMAYMGLGTEKLEKEAAAAFPQARVGRLDADTARPRGEMTRILEGLRDRTIDILVGTQMVTKGHDFPGITVVGVIEADLGLHLPDFRAGERTFQLLAQVGGRSGRGADEGRVIVQTYSPDHYTLALAREHDYLGFCQAELAQRRQLGYPPFSRLILARFQGNSEDRTRRAAMSAAGLGRRLLSGRKANIELVGPAPAPLARLKGKHRFQLLIRGEKVGPLHAFLERWLERVRPSLKGLGVALSVDVDPYQMM